MTNSSSWARLILLNRRFPQQQLGFPEKPNVNQSFTDGNECGEEQTRGADRCQHSLGLVTNTNTRRSKWPSGQPSPAWPRLGLRLRKTTGLNLLSRFHWVKLREWRESYFTDRMRWGFWLQSLMETSKLTWWDNYKGIGGGGGSSAVSTSWHYLLLLLNGIIAVGAAEKCSDVVCQRKLAKTFQRSQLLRAKI